MTFFSANVAKIEHGAWLPLVIGLVLSLVMINWRRGQVVVTRNRIAKEGPLDEFLDGLPDQDPPLVRVPGVAVFLNPTKETTPLALRAEVEHTHTLHEQVAHRLDRHRQHSPRRRLRPPRRGTLGSGRFKVAHVTIRLGYQDKLDVPGVATICAEATACSRRNLDLEHASYFVSRISISPAKAAP